MRRLFLLGEQAEKEFFFAIRKMNKFNRVEKRKVKRPEWDSKKNGTYIKSKYGEL